MTEANKYSAPNPSEVLSQQSQNLATVKQAVSTAISEVKTTYGKTLEEAAGEAAAKIAAAAAERDAGITASQQTVAEKAAAAEAARQAWLAAQADLNSAKDTHQKTTGSLTTTFNQASAKADGEKSEKELAADKSSREAVKAEKNKVKKAKQDRRHAVVEEVLALKDHKITRTRETIQGIQYGFSYLSHNIARVFNEGRGQAPGVALPERLAKRAQAAQGEAAPAETPAPAAPKAEGPGAPGQ